MPRSDLGRLTRRNHRDQLGVTICCKTFDHASFDLSEKGRSMPDGISKTSFNFEVAAIFGFGVIFVSVILILAFVFPNPSPMQYLVTRVVLALSTASVATLLTGFISVEIPKIV